MLIVPCIQTVAFYLILRRPRNQPFSSSESPYVDETTSLLSHQRATPHIAAPTFHEKLNYLPKLLIYILPLFAVYFCEYFINQGLVSNCLNRSTYSNVREIKKKNLWYFPVWIDLFPGYLARPWRPISMATSWLPNWRVRVPIHGEFNHNKKYLADVNAANGERICIQLRSHLYGRAKHLADVFGCLLGRIAGWQLLCQHILSHCTGGARTFSHICHGSGGHWRIVWYCWSRFAGNSGTQCHLQITCEHVNMIFKCNQMENPIVESVDNNDYGNIYSLSPINCKFIKTITVRKERSEAITVTKIAKTGVN